MQFMDHRIVDPCSFPPNIVWSYYMLTRLILLLHDPVFYTSVAVWDVVVTRVKFNNAIHIQQMICCCCYCHPLSFSQKTVKKNKKGRKRETTALHSIVALQNCWWFCWLGDQNPLLLTTESPGAIIKNTYGRATNITVLLCTNPSRTGRL